VSVVVEKLQYPKVPKDLKLLTNLIRDVRVVGMKHGKLVRVCVNLGETKLCLVEGTDYWTAPLK
jgi:hypothetical protein